VKLGGTLTAFLVFGGIQLVSAEAKAADVIVIGTGSFGCNTAWHS